MVVQVVDMDMISIMRRERLEVPAKEMVVGEPAEPL
tara:strand:+ start:568 stop:675 length:108 start_codon:yes stop_codon:yes gene_type:complete